LEFLRRTEIVASNGTTYRLLDSIDVITGVSGGSFTALAYGLSGEKLFDDYEQRFLKRDVQGELIARAMSPRYWGDLLSAGWGRSELAAQLYDEILFNGTIDILLKSAGTPIDAFSFETIELLRDTAARWQTMRMLRNSAALAANKDPAVAAALRVPAAEIYAIDVSFSALKHKKKVDYLNLQPTTFVLEPGAVDRLRAAAGTIILDSPEFKRLLRDLGAMLVLQPPAAGRQLPGCARQRTTELEAAADWSSRI
jgi:hypothetical protein